MNESLIVEVEDENLYKLGTKHDMLKQLYSRGQFSIYKEYFMSVEDVSNIESSLRECARMSSTFGGQSYRQCCKCRKEKKLCNFKCHQSLNYSNK